MNCKTIVLRPLAALLALLVLAGCGVGGSESAAVASTAAAQTAAKADGETLITLSGKSAAVDGGGASAEGGVVTVSAAGAYRVTGTLDEGRLLVDVGKEGDVQLVLDNASLHCSTGSPLAVLSARSARITLAEGSVNTLRDGEDYRFEEDEDEPDAALFSKADLTLGGKGELSVTGSYKHALKCKDALVVEDGVYTLTSAQDALHGKDALTVSGGSFTINAGDDALHSDGPLLIAGGEGEIQSSVEGLEGQSVTVTGGSWFVTASDDALNAADDSSSDDPRAAMADDPDCLVKISGGLLWLDAGGDGIDSNGDLVIEGGTVLVSGSAESADSALDYNGSCTVSGGILAAAGSYGMAQSLGDASTQPGFMICFGEAQAADTLINLSDSEGASILSFAPKKRFDCLVLSAPTLALGQSYVLSSGGSCSGEGVRGYFGTADYSGGKTLGTLALSEVATRLMSDGSAAPMRGARGGMPPGGRMGRGGWPASADGRTPEEGATPRLERNIPEGATPRLRRSIPEGATPRGGRNQESASSAAV